MRRQHFLLSACVVAALGFCVSSSVFATSSPQDAPAAEAYVLDEEIFNVPEDKDSAFYRERSKAIEDAISKYAQTNPKRDELEAVFAKANAAMKTIQKKLAFAEDVAANESMRALQIYCMGLAREGNIDELQAIYESESSKDGEIYKSRADFVGLLLDQVHIQQAGEANDADALAKLADELVEKSMKVDITAQYMAQFIQAIAQFNQEVGDKMMKKAVASFQNSGDKLRERIGMSLEGKSRFMNLVGNEMLVEGLYLGGEEIDWSEYRGKVVLVDFWATWCGPCVGEIPNVLNLYEKYHDAGFEVLGYSLDSDLEALEKFEEERKLPWKTASRKLSCDPDGANAKTYVDLTAYYGINAIPTMVLVGKDGKVLDTGARGEHLQELLKEQFPDVK